MTPDDADAIDEYFMREALDLAVEAELAGEVPVGAVVVVDGKVVASARNRVEEFKKASAHAEMLAVDSASEALGDWRLDKAVLYVTKEPCAMCAGVLVNARLGRLVYAMPDDRSGCAGSALDVTGFSGMLHNVPVRGGVLADEAKEIMQRFFKRVRKKQVDR